MDYVRCNKCMNYSYVEYDTDECPHCHKVGYLIDIEQDV